MKSEYAENKPRATNLSESGRDLGSETLLQEGKNISLSPG